MERTIYRFKLNFYASTPILSLPHNAEVLTAQNQHEELVVWVRVDKGWSIWTTPIVQTQAKRFLVCRTGEPVEETILEQFDYLNTVQFEHGDFIVHVFVEKENKPCFK
jgi:hypothetical protein